MESKICTKCQLEINLCDFSKDKTSKDGLQTQCKNCKKEYRKNNKDKLNILQQQYRKNNPDKIASFHQNSLEYQKKYYLLNKEDKNKKSQIYYQENKTKISIKQKEYAQLNKTNRNKNEIYRRKNNNLYNLTVSIRNLIGQSFKNLGVKKNSKTSVILGCSFDEFRSYLESQFLPWMNWDNKGNPKDGVYETNKTWDIDHIIPLTSATTEEELLKLNYYTNLQPLCSYTNRFIKKDN